MKDYFTTLIKGKERVLKVNTYNINNKFLIKLITESLHIDIDSYKATDKFNPLINRLSTPIALSSFIVGSDTLYYEVLQGIYTVAKDDVPGVLKLKVKRRKYGN